MGNLETRFVNKENKLINSTTNKMAIISLRGRYNLLEENKKEKIRLILA